MDDDPDPSGSPHPVAPADTPWLTVDAVEDAGDWSELSPVAPRLSRIAAVLERYVEFDEPCSVALALSDDASVQVLNKQYRGKDSPTNVLSFPAPRQRLPDGERLALGDLVVARETLGREALEQETSLAHHFDHLVVHGLLHLMGYDHETPEDAEEMEGLEIEILADLGVPDPYAGTELEG